MIPGSRRKEITPAADMAARDRLREHRT